MSTAATIPILGADKQVHAIPQDQLGAALSAGGMPVAQMRDTSGQTRWIPSDQVQSARAAGGTVVSRAPDSEEIDFLQKNPGHTWITRDPSFPNRQEGIYPTGPGNEWRNDPTISQFPIDLHLALHTYQGAKVGLMGATAPLMLEATLPQLAGAIGGGTVGGYAGQKIAKAFGAGETGQEIAGDVGGLVGGRLGMNRASSFVSAFREGLTPPPTAEVLQAQGLAQGARVPPQNQSDTLGQIAPPKPAEPAPSVTAPAAAAPPAHPAANPSPQMAASIPRTLIGESALGEVLSKLDNASLIRIAKSRGINVSQEALLKPGTANGLLIKKIAGDFSPDELQEFAAQYLEGSRFQHQFSSQMTPEAWSTVAMKTYFPDVKLPQTVLARTQTAMSATDSMAKALKTVKRR